MQSERDVILPTDLDRAWQLLTRADELAAWLGEASFDPLPGAAGALVEPDGTRRRVVVDEVDPARCLSWWWWRDGDDNEASHVELTLVPAPGGTLLRVVERALPGSPAAGAQARAQAGEAWSHRLLHLEALLLVAAAIRG